MKTRLLSSIAFVLIIAVAFILKFYVSNYFFDALILFIGVVASFETSKIFAKMGRYNDKNMAVIFPFILMLTMILGVVFDESIGIIYTIVLAFAVLILSGFITFFIQLINFKRTSLEIKTRKIVNSNLAKYSLMKALNTMLTFIYPTLLIGFLTLINHFEDLSFSFNHIAEMNGCISLFVLIFAFIVPIYTDTFAYLMGGLIGGKKLAPSISPKKTIAGAIGGFVWCVLLSVTTFFIFNAIPTISELFALTGINSWKIAIISAVGSILGQIGDLFESYIKRLAGVKDSGRIIPGHGGMLDRFDSHAFVAPIIFISFSIIFALI